MNPSSSCVSSFNVTTQNSSAALYAHLPYEPILVLLPEYQWWRTSAVHALVIRARFLHNNKADLATHSEMCRIDSRNSSELRSASSHLGDLRLSGSLVDFYWHFIQAELDCAHPDTVCVKLNTCSVTACSPRRWTSFQCGCVYTVTSKKYSNHPDTRGQTLVFFCPVWRIKDCSLHWLGGALTSSK